MNPREPHARERREVVRLVRRIQELLLEAERIRRKESPAAELQTLERELDELRSRLAVVARRSASDDVDVAA